MSQSHDEATLGPFAGTRWRAPSGLVGQRAAAPNAFMRMLAGTALASALTAAITVAYTGVLATKLGPDRFGGYMLGVRAASTILPLATLAMGIAVPRYIAVAREDARRSAYLLGGLILAVAPCLVLAPGIMMLPDAASELLFGSPSHHGLLFGSLVLLLGYACFSVLYGFYRGLGRMGAANGWRLILMGLAPAAVACSPVAYGGAPPVLVLMGLIGCVALIPLAVPIVNATRSQDVRACLRKALQDLARYGGPRGPFGFVHQWLLALGPFMASRYGGMADAGLLLASQIVFRIAELGGGAFGVVVLPRVAFLHAEGRTEILRQRIDEILTFTFHVGLFVSLHLLIWARTIILVWLGPDYLGAVPLMRAMLAGVIPWIAYVMLRSVIDGIETKPINGINVCLAFLVTALASGISVVLELGTLGLALSITAGQWLLAALSIVCLWKRYRPGLENLMFGKCVAANAAILAAAFVAAGELERHLDGGILLAAGGAAEGAMLAAYCIVMWSWGARWAGELMVRAVPWAKVRQ